jgi:hypothetical protein
MGNVVYVSVLDFCKMFFWNQRLNKTRLNKTQSETFPGPNATLHYGETVTDKFNIVTSQSRVCH